MRMCMGGELVNFNMTSCDAFNVALPSPPHLNQRCLSPLPSESLYLLACCHDSTTLSHITLYHNMLNSDANGASSFQARTSRLQPVPQLYNFASFVHHRLLSSLLDHCPSPSTSDVEECAIPSSPTSMCVLFSLFSFCLSCVLVLSLLLGTHA